MNNGESDQGKEKEFTEEELVWEAYKMGKPQMIFAADQVLPRMAEGADRPSKARMMVAFAHLGNPDEMAEGRLSSEQQEFLQLLTQTASTGDYRRLGTRFPQGTVLGSYRPEEKVGTGAVAIPNIQGMHPKMRPWMTYILQRTKVPVEEYIERLKKEEQLAGVEKRVDRAEEYTREQFEEAGIELEE